MGVNTDHTDEQRFPETFIKFDKRVLSTTFILKSRLQVVVTEDGGDRDEVEYRNMEMGINVQESDPKVAEAAESRSQS